MASKDGDTASGGGAGLIVALALVIIIGAGAGFGFGIFYPNATVVAPPGSVAAPAPHQPHAKDAGATPQVTGSETQLQVFPLDPVLVNLAGSERTWIRLEGAVAFPTTPDKEKSILLAQMSEDIAGYLRGSSIAQLQSAVGLESLREDLSELVQLRSKNRAVRFILRSLAIE